MNPSSGKASQPASNTPWPQGFGPDSRRLAMLFGVLPVLIIGLIAGLWMMTSGLQQGKMGQVLIGAAGILLCLPMLPIPIRVYQTRRSSPPTLHSGKIRDSSHCLPIPRWPLFFAVTSLSLLGSIIAMTLFLFALSFPETATINYRLRSPLVAVLLAVALTIGIWLLLRTLYAARKEQGLWLTPSGVELSNGLMHQAVDWGDIVDVQAAARPRFATIKITSRPGTLDLIWSSTWARKRTRAWLMEIHSLEFDMDSALLYHTIDFYWKHPELRNEIGSRAAINRVRRGAVIDSDTNRQGTRS